MSLIIGGGAIGTIICALFPGLVGLLYQVPLATLVAWLALRGGADWRDARDALLPLVSIIGAGGPVAF